MIPRLVLTLVAAFAAASAAPAQAAIVKFKIDAATGWTAFDPASPSAPVRDIDEVMAVPAAPDTSTTRYTGWSIPKLAGLDPADITGATVSDANGVSQSLSAADITTGSSFDGAPKYPVMGTQGAHGLYFARPRRDGQDQGGYLVNNAAGTGADTSLYVQVETDGKRILSVASIEPSSWHPRSGQAVTFRINGGVSGAAPGALTYAWDFGDGTPAGTDEQPAHTYSAPGAYPVHVTVTDSESNHGLSPELTLVVGDPAPQATATPNAGGTGPPDSLPTGPVHGDQSPASAPTPGAKSGKPPRHSSGAPGRHHQTAAKPGDRTLQQATPTPTPAPGSRSSSGSTSRPGTSSGSAGGRDRKPPPAPAGTPAPAPPAATFGVLVGASAPQAVTDPAAVALAQRLAAARKALAHDQKNDAADVLDTLLGAAAALIVLALGALREFDPRARYRRLAT